MEGTKKLVDRLRSEGFAVSPSYISYLVREGILPPPEQGIARAWFWSPADVGRLKSILLRRGRRPSTATSSVQERQARVRRSTNLRTLMQRLRSEPGGPSPDAPERPE